MNAHSPVHPQVPVEPADLRSNAEKLIAELPKHLEGLNMGRIVFYNDAKGVDHVGIVTHLVDGSGRCSVYVLPRFPGDEAFLVEAARYNPAKSQGSWRWPPKSPHSLTQKIADELGKSPAKQTTVGGTP